jgi:protein-disulfide isomerase
MKLLIAALAILLPVSAAAPDTIHGNAFGDPKAPILIEVFSDFQCPGCKRFHDEDLPLIVKDYVAPGKAYLVYRYFPLAMHPYGRKAAELVCACAQLGKYEQAADILFARQSAWSQDGKLDETLAAVLTPAERQKVATLIGSPSVQKPIDSDMAEGAALGVKGTPTVLVTYKSYRWIKATLDDFLK